MLDGTLITKKADGTMILLDSNNDQTVLDDDGKVSFKNNYRFKLHYNMNGRLSEH